MQSALDSMEVSSRYESSSITAEHLRSIFQQFDIRENPDFDLLKSPTVLRKASVLVPLLYRNGEYHVILTVRSKHLNHHAGFVAFPGGHQDDTDNDHIHTALREAEEEIGLPPENVEVIGLFSPSIVKPNILVYPVLGVLKGSFVPKVNHREVEVIFELPLERFLSSERRKITDFISDEKTFHIHHFIDTIQGKEVDTWGFTSTMCIMTALGVYQSEEPFCFYGDWITTKDTIFNNYLTAYIVKRLLKLEEAKL